MNRKTNEYHRHRTVKKQDAQQERRKTPVTKRQERQNFTPPADLALPDPELAVPVDFVVPERSGTDNRSIPALEREVETLRKRLAAKEKELAAKKLAAIRRYDGQIQSVDQIMDGDTLRDAMVKIADFSDRGAVWPGIMITDNGVFSTLDIRIAGIDAPEMSPRGADRTEESKAREKARAEKARTMLRDLIMSLGDGKFTVTQPAHGKFAGRMLATVWIGDTNVGDALMNADLAKPYTGGQRPSWD